MKIIFITLIPEALEPYLSASMMRKAENIGAAEFSIINLREFGIGPRRTVDDTPYGGGDGMLLTPKPLYDAIEYAKTLTSDARVILPTPRGEPFKQSLAKDLAKRGTDLIIICPKYEGYDERITKFVDYQLCIGNFVLTGGELPALCIADAVVRLLPMVLGGDKSAELESFQADDISKEHPHYTRPLDFMGDKVPDVLLSGNHAEIEKWRQENSK